MSVKLFGDRIVTTPALTYLPRRPFPHACFERVLREVAWFVRARPGLTKVQITVRTIAGVRKTATGDRLRSGRLAGWLKERLIALGVSGTLLQSRVSVEKENGLQSEMTEVELSVAFLTSSLSGDVGELGRIAPQTQVLLPARYGPSGYRTADAVLEARRLARDLAAARRLMVARRFDAACRLLRGLVRRTPDRLDLRELFGLAQAGAGDLSGANETATWVERHHGADRAEQLRARQRVVVAPSR